MSPDAGLFKGTEFGRRVELAAAVKSAAPLQAVLGSRGFPYGVRYYRLACGHEARHEGRPVDHKRCIACLYVELAGPYACRVHDDCKRYPTMAAECWSASGVDRPIVADVVATRLEAQAAKRLPWDKRGRARPRHPVVQALVGKERG